MVYSCVPRKGEGQMKDASPEIGLVHRDTIGLRDALFDELDALRNGTSNSGRANATAKVCGTIIESVRMELEMRKFMQTAPVKGGPAGLPALGEAMGLGSDAS